MNKNLLIKIRTITFAVLFLAVAGSFFMDKEGCYYHGLNILIGTGFVGILSTSIIWYPDLFICIYTELKTPADKIPSWKDVEPARKRTLLFTALFILGIGVYVLYIGISNFVIQACV